MRTERKQLLADVNDLFNNSAYIYLISYQGLKVSQFADLRRQLRAVNAQCHVVKNSYVQKSAISLEMAALADIRFEGDTAVVIGTGDCCATAKVLKDAAKSLKVVSFKGGYLDGKLLSSSDIECLAELPPLNVMRSMLLGVLQAPATNLVGVLNAKVASIVYALKAYHDKKL